jgi:hypothetical protein
MDTLTLNPHDFYALQGQISDPGEFSHHFDTLPDDLPGIIAAIQGVMLHLHWATRYGITLNRVREEEANLRTVRDRLAKIFELQDAPLTEPRPLSKKTVGTCRDFTLLLTSILRQRGIPARARAGFGTYFTPGHFEDHWVCEYWHADESRWVMVDPQLDALQCEALSIDFDPLNMPHIKFITGGQAWQRCRAKRVDPNRFGIFNMRGLDFVKGDLIRDFLALNKIEILPWDNFKLIAKSFRDMNAEEKDLMDRLARISSGEDQDFILLRAAFVTNQGRILPEYFL